MLNFYYTEGCIPSPPSGEWDLTLRNSSSRICYPVPPQPAGTHQGPPKDVMLLQLCCGGSTEKRRRTLHPPASHKHDALCRNVKCILRTDRNVTAHRKCFHPLTRNKTCQVTEGWFCSYQQCWLLSGCAGSPSPSEGIFDVKETAFYENAFLSLPLRVCGFFGHSSLK